jgi:hypothetical protein
MKDPGVLEELSPEQRRVFCQHVLESLSDLVEGQAHADLARSAQRLLGDRAGFRVLCETLAETIDLARECGEEALARIDDDSFRRCVDRVRGELLGEPRQDE